MSESARRSVFDLIRSGAVPCLLALAVGAGAQTPCESFTDLDVEALRTLQFERDGGRWRPLPDDAELELGEITVVRQDVFEQEEHWLHRLANRYHTRTRERVVRSILPMRPGEPVTARLLAEAERLLRAKSYVYDARVIPQRRCGDVLDVFVVTRDLWTLTPRISLVRTGGENDVGLGIGDTNVAGSGKSVLVAYERDEERRGFTLGFTDPNIADSRWATSLLVTDNDDGERVAANLGRPFFALDARHAFAAQIDDFDREEGLYDLGEEIWEYRADSRRLRFSAGWSGGLKDRFVNRWRLGVGFEEHEFDLPAGLAALPGIDDPDRRFVYPFLAFERVEDHYDKRINVDRVRRTEDLALGRRIYAELGYSAGATGGDGRHVIGRVRLADGVWLAERQLLLASAALDGYYDVDGGGMENLAAEAVAEYRYRHATKWSLLVRASAAMLDEPTLDRQLLLGGATGLRGYPNRYQVGDRRWLVTVEERYYPNIYPLRMFRLGAALFFDVGRAWYDGERPAWLPADDGDHRDVLGNVGLGLRFESTRFRGDTVLHLDVAAPLRDGPEVRGVEVTLTAKQSL